MKQIMKKLRSKRGESLVEVLCAVLIFTLSSVAMYSMVMAANNINANAKEADRAHQESMVIVEKAEGAPSAQGTITMTVAGTSDTTAKVRIDVDIYESGELYSYFKAP